MKPQAEHFTQHIGVRRASTETAFIIELRIAGNALFAPEATEKVEGFAAGFTRVTIPARIAADHVDAVEIGDQLAARQIMRYDIDLAEHVRRLGLQVRIIDLFGLFLPGPGHAGGPQFTLDHGPRSRDAPGLQSCSNGRCTDIAQSLARSCLGFQFAARLTNDPFHRFARRGRVMTRSTRERVQDFEIVGRFKAVFPLVDPGLGVAQLFGGLGHRSATAQQVHCALAHLEKSVFIHCDLGANVCADRSISGSTCQRTKFYDVLRV